MIDTTYQPDECDPVLKAVVAHWMTKIKSAKDHKQKVFGAAANEAWSFYNGPRSWDELMGGAGAGMTQNDTFPQPTFKMSVNKTFEYVSIFGPALYYENPVRTVKPRMPVVIPPLFFPDPGFYQALMQQESLRVQADGLRSVLLSAYLNWTPNEYDLAGAARLAITDALIEGRGCLWTELHSPPAASWKSACSFYDSTDNLLVDPDAPSLDKAQWVARRCVQPLWQIERDLGLRRHSLKGNLESQARQADLDSDEDGEYRRKQGQSNDLLVFYKIFSKMGLGGRLQGIKRSFSAPLEIFGDYCYLIVADTCQFPLNLPPDVQNDPAFHADPAKVFARVAWPTPFWAASAGSWPVSTLDFFPVRNSPWPLTPLKAAMGELKFLNWAMSFLAGHVRNSCRDFIATKKSVGEEIKTALLEGTDLTLLELEADQQGTVADLIQFLQHPQVNGDIWKLIEAVENNFDKRIGLTELMYGNGGPTQIRSAEEASLRSSNMNVRPDDMGKQVESWQASVAAKEALCSRYHLIPDDITPVLGQVGGMAWGQYVATQDVTIACHQLEYRIEAGSTRRPNKEWEVKQMSEAMTSLAPLLQQYAQLTGDLAPLNNLIAAYAISRDLDPSKFQLRAMPPPPAPPAGPPGSDPNAAPSGGGAEPGPS